jgi:hypothetical protein
MVSANPSSVTPRDVAALAAQRPLGCQLREQAIHCYGEGIESILAQ